jgi:thioredoxin 1
MAELVTSLTGSTFDEEVGSSETPMLVEFWAEWCPPCKAIAPVLEAIASEQRGGLRVCKINSDEFPEIAARYAVTSVPTLLVFDGGIVVKRLVGARGKRHLLEELADVLREHVERSTV